VRLRITRTLRCEVDGVDLSKFLEGLRYDVGTTLGNYLLAQRWAEPADDDGPAAILPLNRTIHPAGVLIVEDDEDMRAILTQLLEYHGWNTVSASDGVEGLEALQRHRPSLILLDLAMPRMNGRQFRAAQRKLPDRRLASTPCVIVSACDGGARGQVPVERRGRARQAVRRRSAAEIGGKLRPADGPLSLSVCR
jgi:CheY-like chemotaxis protein